MIKKLFLTPVMAMFCCYGFAQTNTFPPSGNVGIGTTSPATLLHVIGSNNVGTIGYTANFNSNLDATNNIGNQVNITNTSYWGLLLGLDGPGVTSTKYHGPWAAYMINVRNGPLYLGANNTAYMTVLPTGFVGINTTAPSAQLEVAGSALINGVKPIKLITNTNGGVFIQGNAGAWAGVHGVQGMSGTNLGGFGVRGAADSVVRYFIGTYNTDEKVSILQSGQMGLGTKTPTSLLHLNNTSLSADGTVMLTIQAAHAASTPGSGGIIKFTNNLDVNEAAAIRTATEGARLVGLRFQTGYGVGTLTDRMTIDNSGKVGIGTTHPDQKLTVNGTIHSTAVKVDNSVPAPDYVFDDNYKLLELNKLKSYLEANHHLPEIPSAAEFEKNGIDLEKMNLQLLKKIEELTLYVIKKDEQIKQQNIKLAEQEKRSTDLEVRLEALEKALIQKTKSNNKFKK